MPKYKDSPAVRAAKKERKEKLREFLSLLDVEDIVKTDRLNTP